MKNKRLNQYKIIITAGGTQEPIDPVRYIGNKSTGKMGIAILKSALKLNLSPVFIYANITTTLPKGKYKSIQTLTANEMFNAIKKEFTKKTILIMAAAVADFKPKQQSTKKIKKSNKKSLILQLVPNIDILKNLGQIKTTQKLIGFAAETEDLLKNARKKLKLKNLDMIIANDISREDIGFGSQCNQVSFITKNEIQNTNKMTKLKLGDDILTQIEKLL